MLSMKMPTRGRKPEIGFFCVELKFSIMDFLARKRFPEYRCQILIKGIKKENFEGGDFIFFTREEIECNYGNDFLM